MGMNDTPRSNRPHITLLGRRNAGKSSILNTLTGQPAAVVSPVGGTTTDPVFKPMELLPVGPIVLVDTAGLDDEGEIGALRRNKTLEILNSTDLALLIIDATTGVSAFEHGLLEKLRAKKIPVIGVLNKTDILAETEKITATLGAELDLSLIPFSASKQWGDAEVKKAIMDALPQNEDRFRIVGDLLSPGDFVVLVVPIDKAAPKGRLILPQQQTIRDTLESDAIAVVTKEHELRLTLERLGRKPRLVITDSQAFMKVAADTPKDVPLTSFSILFARHKGDLDELVRGARAIDRLKDGDRVLIAEACTHQCQSDDIGRVKIPRWLRQTIGKRLIIEHASGSSFPDDLSEYALVIHCGACMLNRRTMLHRMAETEAAGVPIVNYGIFIAFVQGVFPRAIECFPSAMLAWEQAVGAGSHS
ncbi:MULTISPECIES: [FeFe] hydrogenase H-cluster maturation GTPase HydF [unclassified Paenibacillus]|uniref:[FeFe] hydrogenase H-cluster maturation GTPase HydF n=1 Tax=unclassified Paenibacillus TaxID=185978 RepID=UPI0024B9E45C|nr:MULTISPECIES: [FeFe] hydrogenase H-cluster maturation GTPase HydF [unclassified Paenibacillus]